MTTFESEFLDSYLKFGLGSMPKSDIDALVMSLLDKHGLNGSAPMAKLSNQAVSEQLKTPLSKIKKLRYEAALKFGGSVEEQAKGRLLAALAHSSLEPNGEKICLIIEDTLAKNWLQGQLKLHQHIFDHSFNSEIVKVSADGLFQVLESIFDPAALENFKSGYEQAKKASDHAGRKKIFKDLVLKFVEGAAKAAGGAVMAIVKSQVDMPY